MKYVLKYKMVLSEQEASSRKVLQRQLRTAGCRQSAIDQRFMAWRLHGQGHVPACLWFCNCNIKDTVERTFHGAIQKVAAV